MTSVHPGGRLFVTDFTPPLTEPKTSGLWPILVGDLRGGAHVVVHTVDNRGGAASWRRGHPQPNVSPPGQRCDRGDE